MSLRFALPLLCLPALAQTLEMPALPSLPALKAKHPQSPAYYLRHEETTDVPPPGFWKGVEGHLRGVSRDMVVLKAPKGSWTYSLTLEKGATLEAFSLRLTLPEAPVVVVAAGGLTRKELPGGAVRLEYVVPSLPEGTRVEESWSQKIPGLPAVGEVKRNLPAYPTGQLKVSSVLPGSWRTHLKDPFAGQPGTRIQRATHADGSRQVITLEVQDYTPRPTEPLAPMGTDRDQLKQVITMPGQILLSSSEVLARMYTNVADRNPVLDRIVDEIAGNLTRGLKTDREKVQAVYDFLQKQMVLIGRKDENGGLFGGGRNDFADMLRTMKGTPNAQVALMQALLQRGGVPSRLVLIHLPSNGAFDPAFVGSLESYELALWIELEGQPLLASPQEKSRPLGFLLPNQMGRPALVLRKDGPLEVLTTPGPEARASETEETWDLEIDEKGGGTLTWERKATGAAAVHQRELYGLLNEKGLADTALLNTLTLGRPARSVQTLGVENLKDLDKPLLVKGTYRLGNLLAFKGGEFVLDPEALGVYLEAPDRAPLASGPRTLPIRMPFDRKVTRTLTLRFPAVWALQSALPAPATVTRPLGRATRTCTLQGQAITLVQQFQGNHGEYPSSQAGDLEALAGVESPLGVPALRFK